MVQRIREFRKRISPAVLFLMETKHQDEDLFKLFRNTELTNHFTVPPVGLAGGLSLSWKDEIHVEILFSSANIIDTRIEARGTFSFVSFIYDAPKATDRPAFWSKLTELGSERDESWLITGDFNDLLDNSEKVGGPTRWEGSFLSIRSFVSQMGLWDLPHSGNHLSWRGTRYSYFIQSRLDRAMANSSWFERFPAGRCEYLRFEGSDNRSIVIHFDVSTRKNKGLFMFDQRLKDKPEIRDIVATRGRRAVNKFSVIEDSEGKAFCKEEEIVQCITEYYSRIFSGQMSDSSLVVEEGISPLRFFTDGILDARQNETHVRLIPKTTSPKSVADYRPIALCNTHYKIIAKILTRRLQPLLPALISEYQSAFVKGRSIADNVLITHEILHYMQHSSATVRCSMAIKTDMSKAYDRIEWSFLRNVLSRLGFHEKWIMWIMACVTSVSYSYLVNGSAQGRVVPTRGIRQGDPLSPYLFILCTEVLSGLCRKAQLHGDVIGVKVSRNSPAINHLLFADDTIFFSRTNHKSCAKLISILKKYGDASGQCINLNKSSITFLAKTPGDAKRRVRHQFQILNEGGLGKYLGLPEHFGRKKRDIFASLVDRIRQRSHSWTTRFLSGAGKHILLKSVLAAMPTYSMSCFKLPMSLCKQIQSILTRFWWDASPEVKKICWVSWEKLAKPKNAGGLGFREIAQFNDAMLAKLSWRILKEPASLMAKILLGKYCFRSHFLETKTASGASHGWQGILVGRDLLSKVLGWAIGSGSKVNIWNEPWLSPTEPLGVMGPPTTPTKDWKVNKLLTPSMEWDLTIIREHLPQHEEMIRRLIPSTLGMQDERVWLPNASGVYSTKSGYAIAKLCNGYPSDFIFDWKKCIWQVDTSPKIKHFLWKSNNKALPVGSCLASRGLSILPTCKRCGNLETELHVLLQCPFASQVWELVPCLFKPDLLGTSSVSDLLQRCKKMVSLPPLGIGKTPLYPWILWILWTNRNKLLFDNILFSAEDSILKAIQDARAWKAAQTMTATTACPSLPHYVVPSMPYIPPPVNSYTWSSFSDAAWDASTGNCGLGWHLRDSTGFCAENSSSHRRFVTSALVAEALAVKAAVSAAVSSQVSSLQVFSDSKALILFLKTQGQDVALKGILHDIHLLAQSFISISFIFISRLANAQVDSLAKSALYHLRSVTLE
ncbi:uncharacterized protein LOC111206456 [Brassica napus]|nr:uncharacterized protein LOC111206456 [Brassica napus]